MITKVLASKTLTSAAASITFSGISTSYKDLVIITSLKAVTSTSPAQFGSLVLNSNTNNLYIDCYLYGGNATQAASAGSGSLRDYAAVAITKSTTTTNHTNNAIVQIFDYNATNKWKSIITETNDTAQDYYGIIASSFQSTSAVTSVLIKHDAGNLAAGSRVTLMGVA